MIRLEQLKNMAAALSEIRSLEQINEQYLEDFLLENFNEDEIEIIAQLDEEDMQSFVETIGEDLDVDELNAFLEESVHGQQQLDELIGAAARLVGRGIKKAANRMSTAGRADAAERKVKKIQKQRSDRERLKKAKSQLQTLKKTRREEMDPVGKEDDDVDNDGDVDSSDKYLKNRRKAITKAVTKESADPIVPLGGGVKMRVNPNGSIILQDKDPSGEQQLVVFGEKQTKSLISLIKGRKTVKGFKLGGSIRATRESNGAMYIVDDSTPQGRQMIVLEPTAANSIPPIIYKRTGMSESTELDENISKMDDRDLDAMIFKLKLQHNRIQNPDSKDKIRADIKRYEDEQKKRIEKNMNEAKNPLSHRLGLIDKIKKSGVVKSGSMSKKPMKEKAESEAQAIAARIALKHKREGTKPEPGTASAEMMKMSEKDLEDFTKMKKGAPYKVEEAVEIMHNRYMRSHGKKAKNTTGMWAFTTKEYGEPSKDEMVFVNGNLKDAAKQAAEKLGSDRVYVMEATDAEIRAKQTAGATEPEGIADKESEGSKKFMMMHTTQIPNEVNTDEINRMNAEEIKASLQRKVSHRWNDQKIGDK